MHTWIVFACIGSVLSVHDCTAHMQLDAGRSGFHSFIDVREDAKKKDDDFREKNMDA